MRFAFTDDQLAFRDAVRDLLAKECGPDVVRAAWPDGTDAHGARKGEGSRAGAGQVAKVWNDLAEMGVLGIGVSEANGGLGMAEIDWVLIAEETGYAALPHPFVETACVVARHRRSGRGRRGVDGQGPGIGRRPPRGRHLAPVPRRDRVHGRVRPAPVPEAGRGPGSHLGRCRLAPPARGRGPRHLTGQPIGRRSAVVWVGTTLITVWVTGPTAW